MRGTGDKSLRLGALGLLLASLALAAPGCGSLNRDELNRGVESLGALAAQGQLVASGVARDATKSTYARVMAKTLGETAEHEAEKLADASPEAGTEEERATAVAIAGEISQLLSELQTFPGDEHHGSLVQGHLEEAQEKAEALSARLNGEKA
jgi:hypothetical protein